MTSGEPVFVDLHGLGPTPDPGPAWKRCWAGREPLWRVFWGWFVCGHGALLGASVGIMVLSMVFGFILSPQSLDAGVAGMASGGIVMIAVYVIYAFWAALSVWRCAYNCINHRWGHVARAVVILYAFMALSWVAGILIFKINLNA